MAYTLSRQPPKGYEPVAWAHYPSLRGVWQPSKVHLTLEGFVSAKCGARPGRHSDFSRTPSDFAEHEKDAGLCVRCWRLA